MAKGETRRLKIKLQLYCGEEIAMGPGKADLLDAIIAHGSISGAARALGMSYRRAWLLVDAMNRCWREPLVETGHAAQVTPHGQAVLAHYRALEEQADALHGGGDWKALEAGLLKAPRAGGKP